MKLVMTGSNGDVFAKTREHLSLKSLLNVHCVCLTLVHAGSSKELQFLKYFELTLMQRYTFFKNSPKRLNNYLKTAHKMHNLDTFPGSGKSKSFQTGANNFS